MKKKKKIINKINSELIKKYILFIKKQLVITI